VQDSAGSCSGFAASPGDPYQQLRLPILQDMGRVLQHLPASADAFVWLKLYQHQMRGLVPDGPDEPLW
jgi:hypothetical protein